ncbi:hypothetical protein Lalb_Chr04g0254931 [Lupinus albus]|uniref:Uncharacterized protein n=1 Tax=Lupinus albus TaxID=3870 RepID=A0A6A4QNA8_LUPAL|nr:hypothetical protein Lalb_Chr04g0254931 [Lupinus albus]
MILAISFFRHMMLVGRNSNAIERCMAQLLILFDQYPSLGYASIHSIVVKWGPISICLVLLEALHTLSCPIAGSLLDQCVFGPHPETPLRTLTSHQF